MPKADRVFLMGLLGNGCKVFQNINARNLSLVSKSIVIAFKAILKNTQAISQESSYAGMPHYLLPIGSVLASNIIKNTVAFYCCRKSDQGLKKISRSVCLNKSSNVLSTSSRLRKTVEVAFSPIDRGEFLARSTALLKNSCKNTCYFITGSTSKFFNFELTFLSTSRTIATIGSQQGFSAFFLGDADIVQNTMSATHMNILP